MNINLEKSVYLAISIIYVKKKYMLGKCINCSILSFDLKTVPPEYMNACDIRINYRRGTRRSRRKPASMRE